MYVSFICISYKKMFYNLMNISLFFSLSCFSPRFHMTLSFTSTRFLFAGQGKCYFVTVAFLGILTYFYNLNVSELSVITQGAYLSRPIRIYIEIIK